MGGAALSVAVGFVSGLLSGAFGIGGGLVTTPAIRLVLSYPALIAVGTPLPVIVPGAITGAISYHRRGLVDPLAGLVIGAAGATTSVAGAFLSARAGGPVVLLATAALLLWAAGDLALQARDAARRPDELPAGPGVGAGAATAPATPATSRPWGRIVAIGLVAGAYSGFFGLGGGFVVVPALARFCGFSMKRAIGTSLVAVAVLAVPGTIAHAALGHVDWRLAALLALGVIPGAMIGARLTSRASDAAVRIAFAIFLAVVGVWLAVSEIAGFLR